VDWELRWVRHHDGKSPLLVTPRYPALEVGKR
jgi:hypothetical protein